MNDTEWDISYVIFQNELYEFSAIIGHVTLVVIIWTTILMPYL